MAVLQDYRDERPRKLTGLKELGANPYPATDERTRITRQVVEIDETTRVIYLNVM